MDKKFMHIFTQQGLIGFKCSLDESDLASELYMYQQQRCLHLYNKINISWHH